MNEQEVVKEQKHYNDNLISFLKMVAGSRIYYMDIKQNFKENKFLIITEKKYQEDGTVERNKIIVFEEYLDTFVENLNKIVNMAKK